MTATQQQDVSLAQPQNEAEWIAYGDALLRALANVRGERGANSAALKVEADRLKARYEILDLPLERREANLLMHLEEVANALPLRGKKSRDLPSGTVGWRSQPARLEIVDQAKVEQWVRTTCTQGETAKVLEKVTTEKLRKKELDAIAASYETVPDGCESVPASQKFYAQPNES